MKYAKLVLYLIILNLSWYLCTKSNVGMKLAVSEETISRIQKRYFPMLVESLKSIQIPDQEFSYVTALITTVIKLFNIKVEFNSISSDNIILNFNGPEEIKLKGNHIKSTGSLNTSVKSGYLPAIEEQIQIEVHDLNIEISTVLGWQPHKIHRGKHIISLTVSDFKVDLEFDFKFKSTLLNKVKSNFDETIKGKVNEYLKNSIKSTVMPIINEKIQNIYDIIPVYAPIFERIMFDYSLIEKPVILDRVLILNLDGKIVHIGDSNDLSSYPLGSHSLPHIDRTEKGIKVLISPLTINTLIHSMYYSSMLKSGFEIPNIVDLVPKTDGILNLLNPVYIIRKNLISIFGETRKGLIEFDVSHKPSISFSNKILSTNLDLRIAISTWQTNKYELFIGFLLNLSIDAEAKVKPQGIVDASIHNFKINSFQTLRNDIKESKFSEENTLRILINYALSLAQSTINAKFLNHIKFNLPSIAGLVFDDSSVEVRNDFIEFEIRPQFAKIKKMKKKKLFKK